MISVLIPTLNRASLLPGLLASLQRQLLAPDRYEVLVIDNGSTDETPAIVSAFASILPNLRYLVEAEPGLHAGRHKGVREAQGQILVFADDDIEPLPSWLQSIEEVFDSTDVVLMGGNNLPIFMGSPPAWLYALWSKSSPSESHYLSALSIQEHPHGQREFDPYMVWGCNFAIRKDVLLAAGGFHPDGMPQHLIRFRGDGETHVSRYIANNNYKCIFDSRSSVYHKVTPERMTLAYFRKRGFNQGVSDSYAHLRSPSNGSLGGLKASANAGLISKLMNKLRIAKRMTFQKVLPFSPWSINPALVAFQEGYAEGFAFHQSVYVLDPQVRAWVHKETYF